MSKGTLNKVIIIGRLGGDPELRYTPSGAPVATFNVATNESYKDKEGKLIESTDWHRIVAWNKLAEICGQYLKKGSLVYVEGKIKTRSYDDKDGQKKYVTEIRADNMQMLGAKMDGGRGEASLPHPADMGGGMDHAADAGGSSGSDDLPF
ncbi:single-stranded DNA-binding protein [bacterium]|nr:single-stranded DNA-binding protein [bacterium]NUN45134.1 single-stranded DNA-binding protein [bacterium]HMV26129.1 single-stranded DNA-binding protein [bacterium]HMW34689.1 single-stranded DNA-binding protein [bacterium]HMY37126.1 single-stranded DNA-binding protein [bacterium]